MVSNCSSAQSNLSLFQKPTHTLLCALLIVYLLLFINMRSPLIADFCPVCLYPWSSSRNMVLEWMMDITSALAPSCIVNKSLNKRVSRLAFAEERSTKDDPGVLGLRDRDGSVITGNREVGWRSWFVRCQTWWMSGVGHQQCPAGS